MPVTKIRWDQVAYPPGLDAVSGVFVLDLKLSEGFVLPSLPGAAYSVVESSDGGVIVPVIQILSFDASQTEGRAWNFRMPSSFTGSTFKVKGSYYMSSANSSKGVEVACHIAAVGDGDTAVTAKAFDIVNTTPESVPDTAGEEDIFELTVTNNDSVVGNDRVQIVLLRDHDAAGDDAAGDFNLTTLQLEVE